MIRVRKGLKVIIKILLIIIVGLLLLWAAVGSDGIQLIMGGVQKILSGPPDYTKYTVPLSEDVKNDLCSKFTISNSDRLCQPGSTVYAFDIYTDIYNYFDQLPENLKRLDTVQERIGKYQFKMEVREQKESRFFFYLYDFTGDQKFPLVIEFEDDGRIRRFYLSAGRDSG